MASKIPPESTGRAAVYRLVYPDYTGATNFYAAAVFALDLEVLFLPIAYYTFTHFLFRGFPAPARNDCQVTSVVYWMPAMLV